MTMDYLKIIHFFFPPSEHEKIISKTSSQYFSDLSETKLDNGIYSLLPYGNKEVTAAIHLNKYHCHRGAQKLLGLVLFTYLNTIAIPSVIIPIPLSPKRKRERGYNQVQEITSYALAQNNLHIINTSTLYRTRNTTAQTTLARAERLKNMNNAFAVHKHTSKKIENKHLILVDDVLTTGATLQAAKAALTYLKPASITCIALAH